MEMHERLRQAREKAGYRDASEAARAFGWTVPTYISHENGTRGLRPDVAKKYAKSFRVPSQWLLYGEGRNAQDAVSTTKRVVPLVGKVSAGARMYFADHGHLDEVPAPPGASDTTVAVEVDGDSLGPAFNHWLVFYDDVHRPVREELIGKLCVVGLDDGRVLIKILQRARGKPGIFHLLPNASNEPPILDVEVEWAARVKSMVPR